ncbi:MAG: transporter, partial [Bacteroidota bacterium]
VDDVNPIMDVTFDGKHIIDGDLVSPTPEILIEVNDENPLVAISDSNAFELSFKQGTNLATQFEDISVSSDPRVVWEPAQLPENKARLYFYPGRDFPLDDGEYTLRVQGRDQKGNSAGKAGNYYEIRFQVENKSSLTHVLNYPNPFSTSTRFVYTLTGMEMPELFQIHIYTISGRMVKMIDLLEMGDVSIGRNVTNYAWDGTDEYGDRLGNGVYLYRTVIKMPSQDLEMRTDQTDQYFNNGWGKMYLMR